MSRFVFLNLVVGFPAAAIGFGDFAGVPSEAIFIARVLAGSCLLLVVAYLISQAPTATDGKRARRDQRLNSRKPRSP